MHNLILVAGNTTSDDFAPSAVNLEKKQSMPVEEILTDNENLNI